jgi:L-fuconolactonase
MSRRRRTRSSNCRVSTPPPHPGASTAAYRAYVDHALDVFGPERTMYGGDWPFALLAADSYTEIWRNLRACLDDLDQADRHAVLAGTAQRAYRLTIRR